MRALLLAPPGAGKGTQGERLADIYRVPHLATGDLLRSEVERGTPLGRRAAGYMDRGELVPDGLVVALVQNRIGADPPLEGFVLDGFPRTLTQARAAYEWALAHDRTFDAVITLRVADDELVRRVLARGRSSGRSDDSEETVRRRLDVYRANTAPLLGYYRDRGVVLDVDGTGPVDEVTQRIVQALDGRKPPVT